MILDNFIDYLKRRDIKYEVIDKKHKIYRTVFSSEDLDILIYFTFYPKEKFISAQSTIPVLIDEKMTSTMICAANCLNENINFGNFVFNIPSRIFDFRLGNYLTDTEKDDSTYQNIFQCMLEIVDKYNDKIALLAKGLIDMDKFVESISSND